MKTSINGRVVGHRLFAPDPKNPGLEMMRVELELAPLGTAATEKNSKGVIAMSLEAAERFPLRRYVRITIEDTQQVLPLARAANGKAREQGKEASEPR